MHFNRSRYITVTQQLLVTAAVLTVAMSAAGVTTLQIVRPDEGASAGSVLGARDLVPAVRMQEAYVATKPITPKIREVAVSAVDTRAERTLPATTQAPDDEQLNPKLAARLAPKKLAALTAPEKVTGYATVGVTWAPGVDLAENQIEVQVRSEEKGVWSQWSTLPYHDDHGPDAGTSEGEHTRPGTDPLVVGIADDVQMRAMTRDGKAPADLRLALIDPGAGQTVKELPAIDTSKLPASDVDATGAPIENTSNLSSPATDEEAVAGGSTDSAALAAMAVAPKPQIFSRAQWGANEKLREQGPPSYGTIETGFVHHTVNANNYTEAQVPALIRGIYAYHVQARGWRDIGYNFLVDRFGRIWEGRYGGVDRAVVGAHTLGYNEVSFAMSSIGNFDIAKPPQAIIDAYARLFAWKLSLYNIEATATHLWVKNRYLNAINGHRDVGQTACPGRYLYARIPDIRTEAQAIQDAAQKGTPPPTPPTTPPPNTPPAPPTGTLANPGHAKAEPANIAFGAPPNLIGDHYPDLALLNSTTGRVSIAATGGLIGYDAPVTSAGPWNKVSKLFAVGDVTGDGKGDMIGQNIRTAVSRIYRGDGHGHVSAAGTNPSQMLHGMDFAIGAGDFNGDHRPDIIARMRSTKALYLLPGKGNGTFGPKMLLAKHWNYRLTTVAGDLNKDGRPDLAAISAKPRAIFVADGRAGGAITAPREVATLKQTFNSMTSNGDLTGDGIGDLMLRAADGRTVLRPGNGANGLGQYLGPFGDFKALSRLSSGQLTGSAAPDTVGVDSAGRLSVVPENGRTNLRPVVASNIVDKGASQVLDVGDWNGDGKADLVTRDNGGDRLMLFLGNGNGTFAPGVSMGGGFKALTQLAAVGDITGDQRPDLVGKTAKGQMVLFASNGSTGITQPLIRSANKLHTYNQIGTGTWMSNGLPNTVFTSTGGSFVPFAGNTAPATLARRLGTAGGYDWSVGLGDVNGDGTADLLVREKATGNLYLLPGLPGTAGFGPRIYLGGGFQGYQLAG